MDLELVRRALGARTSELEGSLRHAMLANVQFKLNAGKTVGSYNLARCRSITDEIDVKLAEALSISDAWEEIELFYCQEVKTSFDDDRGLTA